MFIRPRNRHTLGARFALALMILSSTFPAFAAIGKWICVDGFDCAWMNAKPTAAASAAQPESGSESSDKPAKSAHACCKKAPGACCPTPGDSFKDAESAESCRLVPPPPPVHAALKSSFQAVAQQMVAPPVASIPLIDLFAAQAADSSVPTLPPDTADLPPAPLRAPRSLRAPPLA